MGIFPMMEQLFNRIKRIPVNEIILYNNLDLSWHLSFELFTLLIGTVINFSLFLYIDHIT